MRAFGEVLVENRKKKGYSQADLVDLLAQEGIEVTTKAVSKWENLTREPSLHTILTVCQILDIEDIYEEFLGENPFDHVMEKLRLLNLPIFCGRLESIFRIEPISFHLKIISRLQ